MMHLAEWMAWKKISTAEMSIKLKVSKDTIRKWVNGRTPARQYRDIIFDWSNGRVVWDVDKIFKDHPGTVTDRLGRRDIKR